MHVVVIYVINRRIYQLLSRIVRIVHIYAHTMNIVRITFQHNVYLFSYSLG